MGGGDRLDYNGRTAEEDVPSKCTKKMRLHKMAAMQHLGEGPAHREY